MAAFQKALTIAEELGRKDPDDSHNHQLVGEAARRLADIERQTDPRAAMAVYDAGIRDIRNAKSTNVASQRTEASLLTASSYALRALHRDGEAKRRLDEAFELLRKTGDYPAANIQLGSEADFALRALASHYAANRQPGAAADTLRELLSKAKASNRDPKEDLRNALYVSDIYSELARVQRQDRHAQEAAAWEAARNEIWQHWDRKLPKNAFVQRQLALTRPN